MRNPIEGRFFEGTRNFCKRHGALSCFECALAALREAESAPKEAWADPSWTRLENKLVARQTDPAGPHLVEDVAESRILQILCGWAWDRGAEAETELRAVAKRCIDIVDAYATTAQVNADRHGLGNDFGQLRHHEAIKLRQVVEDLKRSLR